MRIQVTAELVVREEHVALITLKIPERDREKNGLGVDARQV